jgi:hypothetical protein
MPRFRRLSERDASLSLRLAQAPDSLPRLLSEVLRPCHFYAGKDLQLKLLHCSHETLPWEIYRGRLLDHKQTRRQQTFESWNLYRIENGTRSEQPLIAIKLDRDGRQLHVTRSVYSHTWEGYDAGNNTFLSREARKWVQEWVLTISLDHFADLIELEDELVSVVFRAVVGSSRLPLTSLESPLPDFSLGRLAYCYPPGPASEPAGQLPLENWQQLVDRGLHAALGETETAKLLESLLRSVAADEVEAASQSFARLYWALGHDGAAILALCRTVFNDIALSPYTDFVSKFLLFLETLERKSHISAEERADFLSYLLRQLSRHLTAYDLVVYHHQGANYPDGLMLDEVLGAYLALIETRPDLFSGAAEGDPPARRRQRLRRRALRQGYLHRLLYDGLLVPDAPTSPGENTRVLPPPHTRVPEEQVLMPSKRSRRLFTEPLEAMSRPQVQAVWAEALAELSMAAELRELGLGLFLDRPLGQFKDPGEPDRTPLLSYEAFSAAIARRRLNLLHQRFPMLIGPDMAYEKTLAALQEEGLPVREGRPARPGSVSLADARRVADDFRLLRTTRGSARQFFQLFDFSVLERTGRESPNEETISVIADAGAVGGGSPGNLLIYRADWTRWLELAVDASQGFQTRAGCEFPVAGLRVLPSGVDCPLVIPPLA